MVKILKNLYCPHFEYFYMFVMVLYMAQMTEETGRMVGTLSGNPVPFLFPIILTGILLYRNPISFHHKKLWRFVGIMAVWTGAVCYKFNDFSTSNLSYYFFLFYAIFIAFIHVRVFGSRLFHIYEHIMVVLSAIALVMWVLGLLVPGFSDLYRLFPPTQQGNHVFYLFNWLTPEHWEGYPFARNAGCSWEPGRFAIMIIPAIFFNLSRLGICFRGNRSIIILLLALASTMSTTGYSIAILIYSIYWLQNFNFKKLILFVFLLLPTASYLFTFDFMAGKIEDRMSFDALSEERIQGYEYNSTHSGDEYLGSLDRFESAYLEWINFQEEPLLGYGRNTDYSWFRQEITQNFVLTGSLVKIFSQYGIFIGLLLYSILFLSSFKISRTYPYSNRFVFALTILLSSISYTIFSIPIFTAFWLYGLFSYNRDEHIESIVRNDKLPI